MDKVRAPWRWSVSDDRRCTVIYDAEDRPVAWLTDDDVAHHVCGLVNLEHVRLAMESERGVIRTPGNTPAKES